MKRVSRKLSVSQRRCRGKSHFGAVLLKRYGDRISTGWEDLERFEMVDEFKKPVVGFGFRGGNKVFLELEGLLKESGYAFWIRTTKGKKVRELSKMGSSSAYVYVSKFPKLIKFISKSCGSFSDDLWGLLFGYPLEEVYQFAYENNAWRRKHF